jgi:hypothetical protein
LNEQASKTSIKNQVLGKDVDRNEYWFFKEDPSKLFVKKFINLSPTVLPISSIKKEEAEEGNIIDTSSK